MKTIIDLRAYISYKLINSIYAGSAMGSVFIIYSTLPPAVFSGGGILLALGGWSVALYYVRLIQMKWFFRIGLTVELVTLALTVGFLVFSDAKWVAFFVYSAYQIVFLFGNYLVRAETKLMNKTPLFGMIDAAKQKGYLVGLALSFAFYEALELSGFANAKEQVLFLYFLLAVLQVAVLHRYLVSFRKVFE
jgi:putative membrane protein